MAVRRSAGSSPPRAGPPKPVEITVRDPVSVEDARRLYAELVDAVAARPARVEVDLTGCADLSPTILAALVRAGRLARHARISFEVYGNERAATVIGRNGVGRWVPVTGHR